MRILVQRSLEAKVEVDDKIVGSIEKGMVILVGFTYNDTIEDIDYLINKVVNLRIYDDENGVMNKSILDVGGEILSVSQFTLYADASKGRRPSYINALNGDAAISLYDEFNKRLSKYINVSTGIFGADMKVSLTNDGPITILLESRKHE
ncbi:MAG: D-tyrosyl-tRNA(Tyr) deacylase [Bacilli bacterium]|nr:D-tyrosyl-tRNA(Tyr) deacylase [Bacilli bacterium]